MEISLIEPSGDITSLFYDPYQLNVFQIEEYVGGPLEIIEISEDLRMFVNVRGMLEKLPINQKAIDICNAFGGSHYISGNVVLVPKVLLLH